MIANRELYQAYAVTLIFLVLVFAQLWIIYSVPYPVRKWHEAAVSIEHSAYKVNQPEHYFIEYSDGSIQKVEKQEWENELRN